MQFKPDIPKFLTRPDRIPGSRSLYAWADYAELICLLNPDYEISKADLLNHINVRKDLGEDTREPQTTIDEDENDSGNEFETTQSELNDRLQLRVDDLFRHLQYRVGEFKEFYPFRLSSDGDVLFKRSRLNIFRKLYVFFLLASSLKYINKKEQSWLTDDFELVSFEALKSYFPRNTNLFLFGKNRHNKNRFRGKLKDKIKRLANDLHETYMPDVEKIPERDTGDNGLDIVAWLDPGDKNKSLISFFAQCACSEAEWSKKQLESNWARWKDFISMKVPPVNIIFIPFSFRDSSGAWHQPLKINDSFMVDRVRALLMLKKNLHKVIKCRSFKFVKKVAA